MDQVSKLDGSEYGRSVQSFRALFDEVGSCWNARRAYGALAGARSCISPRSLSFDIAGAKGPVRFALYLFTQQLSSRHHPVLVVENGSDPGRVQSQTRFPTVFLCLNFQVEITDCDDECLETHFWISSTTVLDGTVETMEKCCMEVVNGLKWV